MKTIFKVVPVVLALSTLLSGCAVYGPAPGYSQGYAPAPVYFQPAPVYVYPPVTFGFRYWGGGHGRRWGGGGHHHR